MDRMNLGPDDYDPFDDPEILAELQARQAKARAKAPPQRPEPQASSAPRLTRHDNPPTSGDPTRMIINAIEAHHRAVGAYLKTVEAHITHLRCTTYLNDPEADKALDSINKAIEKARRAL